MMKMRNAEDQKISDAFYKLPAMLIETAVRMFKPVVGEPCGDGIPFQILDLGTNDVHASTVFPKETQNIANEMDYFFKKSVMKYAVDNFPHMNDLFSIKVLLAIREMPEDKFQALIPTWYKEGMREIEEESKKNK